jgi:hypothetical protein
MDLPVKMAAEGMHWFSDSVPGQWSSDNVTMGTTVTLAMREVQRQQVGKRLQARRVRATQGPGG